MATLGDIIAAGDTIPEIVPDGKGVFAVFTIMGGVKTTYLLRGNETDYDAEIVGRIEHVNGEVKPYRGGDLTGGNEAVRPGTK